MVLSEGPTESREKRKPAPREPAAPTAARRAADLRAERARAKVLDMVPPRGV